MASGVFTIVDKYKCRDTKKNKLYVTDARKGLKR
jgi:hypothetical protein